MADPPPDVVEERERLQRIHLNVEASLEQLSYAQQAAAKGTEIGAPSEDVKEIERILGELTLLRNRLRERLMKLLSKPTLTVLR